MHTTRSPDDEAYPYEYSYYRKPAAHEGDVRRTQVYKYGDAESELLYNGKPDEPEKAVNMPYYVVPVLYVPKRVVPNEEMQTAQAQSVPKRKQSRCTSQEIDRYERYRSYYSQYYADVGANTGLTQDASYYNVQYAGSSSSFKEDLPTDYSQTYSYTYMPKAKVKIRHPQSCETKINTRTAYECKSRHNTNTAYYYPDNKEAYYENVQPQQQQQQQQQQYYYPTENPQQRQIENKPTRIAGSCNKAIATIEEKNVIERATQTTETRMNSPTVSTQTEFAEKKSLIPSCRPKVQIENVYSDEEDRSSSENKPKETRRCPSAKRPTTSYQCVDQHPTRMPSPIRRSKKF